MQHLISIFLHLDTYLATIVSEHGPYALLLLFLVVFLETGIVVTPFLPGDSLLFASGALAATGAFEVLPLALMLAVAAILGDALNYTIGHSFGHSMIEKGKFLGLPVKRAYVEKARAFYDKHGAKTIVLARFIPIVRTFAPFVAGVGEMPYRKFFLYNVAGAVAWVSLFVFGGYFFGNLPFVKDRFSLVVIAIIGISLLPIAIEVIKARRK